MNPIIVAGPAVEPVGLAEMKAYLRLDGNDEDDLVAALCTAARITVERHGRLALIEQTWRLVLREWPRRRCLRLPLGPILGIDAVRVSEESGSLVELGPEFFRLDESGGLAHLVLEAPAPDPAGPSPRIEVDFSCGFGPAPTDVPESLVLAVRRLAALWFEHRGDEPNAATPGLPSGIAALIAPFTRRRVA